MAVEQITYTNFSDQESGLSVRNKINALGQSVANNSVELVAKLAAIDTSITDIETDVTALQAATVAPSIVGLGTALALTPQTLTPNIAEKLTWFTTANLDFGDDISYSIPNQTITVNTTGVYRFGGIFTFEAPINDVLELRIYLNGVASPFRDNMIARGDGADVSSPYYNIGNLTAGDVIEFRIMSEGAEVTVKYASVVLEITQY